MDPGPVPNAQEPVIVLRNRMWMEYSKLSSSQWPLWEDLVCFTLSSKPAEAQVAFVEHVPKMVPVLVRISLWGSTFPMLPPLTRPSKQPLPHLKGVWGALAKGLGGFRVWD